MIWKSRSNRESGIFPNCNECKTRILVSAKRTNGQRKKDEQMRWDRCLNIPQRSWNFYALRFLYFPK
ncbi:hypothetical protein ACH3XW_33770 [Acanthocheilonema viteae]